jgi:phosphate transport system permease protein
MKAYVQKGILAWSWIASLALVSAVAAIIGFLVINSLPVLGRQLVFGATDPLAALLLKKPVFDGLLPAMVGTFVLVLTAVGLALPVGLAAGIYLAEYARGRLKAALSLLFDVLAGIPSIVIGLLGFSLAIFLHQHLSDRIYPCLLISALALAFLVLPYLIRSTQTALEGLPARERITAPSLGATKLQNIRFVLLPRAMDGILSGIILAIGRSAEDTAVIMLTGAVATAGIPASLLGAYEALPFYIYYIASQYTDRQELLRGYGAAVILLLICGALFLLSYVIKSVMQRRLQRGR